MDAERVRAEVSRILASAAFADAERASNFLRFVVDRTLEGRAGEIKEFVIAVEVLGRTSSFDSKIDPIVRVEAGRLRDRLGSYYEEEGEEDLVVISLPKGGYVPEFSERRRPAAPSRAAVMRLSILPPENASFESFAVSPDGRKLAFTAAARGRMMLWVRALDSLEARPLGGTDNAAYPFWSPDNLSIGFFVPNKLKVVEVSGGPPRDIADVVVGRGGAWSPEGVIVFCPRPIGVLYKISATGGAATPVTSLDESRAEITHAFPQFLPGGRQFVYLAASCRPGESSIRAGSLDSTASKVLLRADTGAIYAPILPGYGASLLFMHDGALIAQPFDACSLQLSGERRVVAPEVRHQRWQQASFSVSSDGVLLYQDPQHKQLSWFDRQGKLLASVGPTNDCLSFTLSPDERYVALHRHDDADTVLPTIWVMDLLREGAIFRFTDIGARESELTPVWSPDSSEILFARGDDRGMRLLRQALNGGPAHCILDTEGPKFPNDWSSDGQFIAYSSQVPDYQNMHTWIVSLSASGQQWKPRPFLQHSCSEVSAYFSPGQEQEKEGPRWIAYTSNETGRHEVYVQDFPAGSHKWQVSNQGGFIPHWRSDGRELFYLAPEGTLVAVAVNAGPTFQFGAPQALFGTGFRFTPAYKIWMNQYAVARDGQRFLFNRETTEGKPGAINAVVPW